MSTERAASATNPVPGVPAEIPDDPEALRRQIEQTRAEVGKTVEALAAKTDLKAQAKGKIGDVKAQAKEKVDDVKEQASAKVAELRGRGGDTSPDQADNRAGDVLNGVQERAKAQPVLTFVAGIVVGFIVGKIMG
jgi:ElaB/YqjD/DUF883 family membrane-anchored ribosome-binding protein